MLGDKEKIKKMIKEREKKEVAKTNIVYLNNKGEIVDKDKAEQVIIAEYDKDGNLINEVFAHCEEQNNEKEQEGEER